MTGQATALMPSGISLLALTKQRQRGVNLLTNQQGGSFNVLNAAREYRGQIEANGTAFTGCGKSVK